MFSAFWTILLAASTILSRAAVPEIRFYARQGGPAAALPDASHRLIVRAVALPPELAPVRADSPFAKP